MKLIRLAKHRPEYPFAVHRTLSPKLAFRVHDGMHLIAWHEISRCEASGNYTCIRLQEGSQLLVSKTLACVEAVLPSRHFLRIHQSHLININSIRHAGTEQVRLTCGTTVPVARSRKGELQNVLKMRCTMV